MPRLERRILADRLQRAVGPRHRLVRIDQHLGVGTGAVCLPDQLAAIDVVGGEKSAHAPFAARNPRDHLVLEHMRRVGVDRADFGIAVLDGPKHFACSRIKRDQRAVGLLQEDFLFRVREAPIHGVAAHLRYHGGVLLRFVAPFDFLCIDIDREYFVGKRRMQIHHAVDNQRRALVTAQHAGGEHPRDLHLADVLRVDLRQLAVPLVVHIAGLHRPVLGICSQLLDVRVRQCGAGTREQPRRSQRSVNPRAC